MSTEVNQESRSMKTFLIKSLIAMTVIFLGVSGGIYVGSAFTGQKIGELTLEDLPNNSLLEIGDEFPDYPMTVISTGEESRLHTLLSENRGVLIFVNPTCEPCHTLAAFWDKKVSDDLDTDIRVFTVYDKEEIKETSYSETPILLKNAVSLATDRFNQGKSDRLISTPTVVGLGPDGIIRFISSGFSKGLDASFVNKYL